MIKAKWKAGFERLFNADAQKVADEIISIDGDPTPEEVVDLARNENTELHKCFTWDDTVAAEKYRKYEARQILCKLVIVEENKPENRPEIRVFYKVEDTEGYKPTEFVVKRADEYAKLLERAYAELRAFKIKYSCLKELREIFDLID